VLQVNGKGWARPETIKTLLDALESACQIRLGRCAQAAFCPTGKPRSVFWRA
jgi:hypothetical protein